MHLASTCGLLQIWRCCTRSPRPTVLSDLTTAHDSNPSADDIIVIGHKHLIYVAAPSPAAAPLIARVLLLLLLLLLLRQAIAAAPSAHAGVVAHPAAAPATAVAQWRTILALPGCIPAAVLPGAESAIIGTRSRPAPACVRGGAAREIRAARRAGAHGPVTAGEAPVHAGSRRQPPQLVLAVREVAALAEPAELGA